MLWIKYMEEIIKGKLIIMGVGNYTYFFYKKWLTNKNICITIPTQQDDWRLKWIKFQKSNN